MILLVCILTSLAVLSVHAHLLKPACYVRAAYCSSSSVQSLTCREPCTSLGDVEILLTGGDDVETPRFYIAHNRSANSIVVSHQGTNSHNILSILNDLELLRNPLNSTLFPKAPTEASLHAGFYETFDRTAQSVLSTVSAGLKSKGADNVLIVGHSLGAAIAVLDGMMLKTMLPANVPVQTRVFGLPRMGNSEWASFVDDTISDAFTFVTNNQDPVPQVPPTILGFKHPSHEVHIQSGNVTVSCNGQENTHCSAGNSLLDSLIADHRGPYFKAAISLVCDCG
ncbi:alpha/beta-hydrolase [Gloeophyllum trabeum ATCC 11539]|uniref:Alpha/beta-hydrolase n=1 Tax=Gloeophyllum trabeum (strain ATCC 11539 / FP-39264 / Madison 617) TaxID=670483 RepID=S7QFB4_GLOTA|nr:alpha/beta-hydrolase [Gloeophyllum trabeum ATCC 11539]EPQ58491.1 alpha/beta-hydrolase [Gloeophyllum trabeum ATCC 11539]